MPWKKWSNKENEYLKEQYGKISTNQIALNLKRTLTSVEKHAAYLGLKYDKDKLQENLVKQTVLMRKKIEEKKKGKVDRYKGYNILSIVYFASIDILRRKRIKKYPLEVVMEDVCEVFDIDIDQLKGPSRKGVLPSARQIYCYVARVMHPNKSWEEIAFSVGYAQHSMALVNFEIVETALRIKDPSFLKEWYHFVEHTNIFKR